MDMVNVISVCETATCELSATGARMIVRISGKSFVTGTQAFRKAAEVAACIASLQKCGVTEDEIRLLNVSVEVDSGILTKSSSATYDLEVKCASIGNLAPVIAAISSQKNSKITSIAWDYPDLAETRKRVLQDAVEQARASATAIAAALNVPMLGVHKLSYAETGLDTDLPIPGPRFARSRSMMLESDTAVLNSGLNFSHTTNVGITVKADFLVATITESKNTE